MGSPTSYGSMTSNRKTSGKGASLKRLPGGAKKATKIKGGGGKNRSPGKRSRAVAHKKGY